MKKMYAKIRSISIAKHKKKVLIILLFTIILLVVTLFLHINKQYKQFLNYKYPEATQTIYSADGYVLYQVPATNSNYFQYVALDDISDNLISSVIQSEDRSFYERSPIRLRDIFSSIYSTIKGNYRGGSNITQQLIKIRMQYPQRTVGNKIDEILVTYLVERDYSKDEILEMYLNSIDWGNMATGVYSASQRYLSQTPDNLTLKQSTYLVAIMRAPSLYSPYENRVQLDIIQQSILDVMIERGIISDTEYQIASNESVNFTPTSINMLAPHFVQTILAINIDDTEIYTTINYEMYRNINNITLSQQDFLSKEYNAHNVGIILINNHTNNVEVMVGNFSFWDHEYQGNVNNTTAVRQIGSTVKPFLVALAIKEGISTQTLLADIERVYMTKDEDGALKKYYPRNADKQQHGIVTLEEALANSYNIPFVQLLDYLGEDKFYQFLVDAGYLQDDISLSSAVGTVSLSLTDLTNFYTIFTNDGRLCQYNIIQNEDQECVELFGNNGNKIADGVTTALLKRELGTETFGTQLLFPLNTEYVIKTGTTSEFKDNWAISYTPDYTLGVWVGNANGAPMSQSYGSQTSAQLSRSIWNYLENKGFLTNYQFELSFFEQDIDIYKVLIPDEKDFSIVYPYDGMEIVGSDNTRVTVQLVQRNSEEKFNVYNNGKLIGSTKDGIIEVLLNKGENKICVEEECIAISN